MSNEILIRNIRRKKNIGQYLVSYRKYSYQKQEFWTDRFDFDVLFIILMALFISHWQYLPENSSV